MCDDTNTLKIETVYPNNALLFGHGPYSLTFLTY